MKKLKFIQIMVLALVALFALCACDIFIFSDKTDVTNETTNKATTTVSSKPVETTANCEPTTTETVVTEPISEEDELSEIDISSMSLEEKIAQMILVSCHTEVDIEDAVSKGVGGLCLYAFSFEDKTAEEVVDMNNSYQSLADIPLIISTDEEGGEVNRVSLNENLRLVPFWSPQDLYAEGGFELIKSDTEEKADLLLSLGINVNLAPVCDVPLSEDNYIYDRTFSMDAEETGEYVSLVVSTMKDKGIGSTLKHFPGYGGSVDTHENVSYDDRDYSAFENGDFIPFIKGIENGADSVLVSHNIVECMDPEMPASLSKPIHDILRNDLGFTGVIITDDLIMNAITEFTDGENAAVYAVMAGNDMLCCQDYDEAIISIVNAVEDGTISEEQIDKSVMRIFKWKRDLNLL